MRVTWIIFYTNVQGDLETITVEDATAVEVRARVEFLRGRAGFANLRAERVI